MKKQLMALILIIAAFMCLATVCSADTQKEISLYVNGEKIHSEVPPQIINGTTLVPLRVIFEALGATVEWDNATKTVSSTLGEESIKLTIGESSLYKNDTAITLSVPAQIIDGRTMVPVRAISEAFGCLVSWNAPINTVHIKGEQSNLPTRNEYSGQPFVAVNENKPFFDIGDYNSTSFEMYIPLDDYDRCNYAFAMLGLETMSDEPRGDISSVKPTGWINVKYDNISGSYLYNRCHLIGYQLSGENANKYNLITGTSYLNLKGMLPFENMVADYIKETGNHVLYRVTPVFKADNLVADGVLLEAMSFEDKGEGICFNVFCFNVQPGVDINYSDGSSKLAGEPVIETVTLYVLNTNTKKFHVSDCRTIAKMKAENRVDSGLMRTEIINKPCAS